MNKALALAVMTVIATSSGCGMPMKQDYHELSATYDEATRQSVGPLQPLPEDPPKLAVVDPRKVIYTASLKIATADARAAVARTRALADSLGGYMQRMTNDAIVIRVPAESFDRAMEALADVGTIVDQQVTARDVTEEYADQAMRLKNARALLDKLQALLEKATVVEDALAIERQIARVQTEIERLEGQLNSLASQVTYATLTIHFVSGQQIPAGMKLRLPFWWLERLGLENLMVF